MVGDRFSSRIRNAADESFTREQRLAKCLQIPARRSGKPFHPIDLQCHRRAIDKRGLKGHPRMRC